MRKRRRAALGYITAAGQRRVGFLTGPGAVSSHAAKGQPPPSARNAQASLSWRRRGAPPGPGWTDKGPSQSEQDLARLAEAGTAVCPTPGMAGTPEPTPNAAALLAKLGMTFEQVMEMNKRRVGQMHAAGVRVVSGSDGGIAAVKPDGLLPGSVAFLVEGGVSTVAALASATALAAAACGLGDRKGRLRAGYDADLLIVDGDPAADIGALARPAAVFAGGRRPARAA